MGKKIDLTGNIYGRLTVIREVEPHIKPSGQIARKWLCKCECGVIKKIVGDSLRKGVAQSCGCYNKEKAIQRKTTHGLTKTKEYRAWQNMKKRCLNPSALKYADYGGRGITVCDEWIDSFEQFLLDVGLAPSPTHSIDRIDANGNYEPSNVRWATKTVQAINQRTRLSNTSGHKGVFFHKRRNKWCARITLNSKQIDLGYFSNIEDAIEARLKAEELYHAPLLK